MEELTSKIHCSLRMQEFMNFWNLRVDEACLVRRFPNPFLPGNSLRLRVRAGGKRLDQNRMRMRALLFEIKNVVDVVNSRKLCFFKKPCGYLRDRMWPTVFHSN